MALYNPPILRSIVQFFHLGAMANILVHSGSLEKFKIIWLQEIGLLYRICVQTWLSMYLGCVYILAVKKLLVLYIFPLALCILWLWKNFWMCIASILWHYVSSGCEKISGYVYLPSGCMYPLASKKLLDVYSFYPLALCILRLCMKNVWLCNMYAITPNLFT